MVSADDLGLSPAVNDAILAALAAGVCTSTSVLATGPAFDDAMRRLPQGADLGVHLDLTEFEPLTGAPELAELRGGREDFEVRVARVAARAPSAILAEWSAQLRRVREAGFEVTHVDSHQHLHWQPAIWPLLRRWCGEAGVAAVRPVTSWRADAPGLLGAPQALRAARFRRAFRGVWHPREMLSVTAFCARLSRFGLRGLSTLELMAHPGNPHHARYAEELAWLAGDWDGWRSRLALVRFDDAPPPRRPAPAYPARSD